MPTIVVVFPKGPRAQMIGFCCPNITICMVFVPQKPVIWVLGPLGIVSEQNFKYPSDPWALGFDI